MLPGQPLALMAALRQGQLGQPVGPGAGVLGAVPTGPVGGGGEPEVRPGIDDDQIGIGGGQLLGELGRGAVRQTEDDGVVGGQTLRIQVGELGGESRDTRQLRHERCDGLTGVAVGGERAEPQARVPGDDPGGLRACVAGGPGHRNYECLCSHTNIYTSSSVGSQPDGNARHDG